MLRSINEALDILKKDDAETAVTVYLIRQLCKTEKVKHIESGKKYLVDMRSLRAYLGMSKES
jgi:hypothetical protein